MVFQTKVHWDEPAWPLSCKSPSCLLIIPFFVSIIVVMIPLLRYNMEASTR